MVYDERSAEDGSVDSSATFQNMHVRLRSISPNLVWEQNRVQSQAQQIPAELLASKPAPYKLGLYDVVTVAVWEHPELSMPLGQYRSDLASGQMVDENGNIFYPYAGMVPSKGLTPGQLRESLLGMLSKVLNNPQLDVKVTGFRSQKVMVHGAVAKPGVVPVTDVPLTLLDAVNQCGGVNLQGTITGDASRVELVREGKTYLIDLNGAYGNAAGPSSVILQNNDVIRVASREENKVYVLGEVQKQAAIPLVNGKLNLVQALAEVGGLSPLSAQSKGIYVIRSTDSTHIDVFHLNARNPLALALGDQFSLEPRDVIFVDATGLARWNRVLNLILPSTNLLANPIGTAVDIKALAQ